MHRRPPPARAGARRSPPTSGPRCSTRRASPARSGWPPSKFVAKLASEAAKPRHRRRGPGARARREGRRRRTRCSPSSTRSRSRRCGASARRPSSQLDRLGVATVGDLAALRGATLPSPPSAHASGRHLHALANGIDDRGGRARPAGRSRSATRRPSPATTTASTRSSASSCASPTPWRRGCGRTGWPGARSRIKVRFHDFRTITRSATLPAPIDTGPTIVRGRHGAARPGRSHARGAAARASASAAWPTAATRQLTLDDVDRRRSWDDATEAVDAIRARFGADADRPGDAGRARRPPAAASTTTAVGPDEPG